MGIGVQKRRRGGLNELKLRSMDERETTGISDGDGNMEQGLNDWRTAD